MILVVSLPLCPHTGPTRAALPCLHHLQVPCVLVLLRTFLWFAHQTSRSLGYYLLVFHLVFLTARGILRNPRQLPLLLFCVSSFCVDRSCALPSRSDCTMLWPVCVCQFMSCSFFTWLNTRAPYPRGNPPSSPSSSFCNTSSCLFAISWPQTHFVSCRFWVNWSRCLDFYRFWSCVSWWSWSSISLVSSSWSCISGCFWSLSSSLTGWCCHCLLLLCSSCLLSLRPPLLSSLPWVLQAMMSSGSRDALLFWKHRCTHRCGLVLWSPASTRPSPVIGQWPVVRLQRRSCLRPTVFSITNVLRATRLFLSRPSGRHLEVSPSGVPVTVLRVQQMSHTIWCHCIGCSKHSWQSKFRRSGAADSLSTPSGNASIDRRFWDSVASDMLEEKWAPHASDGLETPRRSAVGRTFVGRGKIEGAHACLFFFLFTHRVILNFWSA